MPPYRKRVYAINELLNSDTSSDYDAASGTLAEKQTISTLSSEFKGTSLCADLKMTPDGRFLYATNRKQDSIAAFRIGEDGRPSLVTVEPCLEKGPQNLAITSDGQGIPCANMPGNNFAVFEIDPKNGRLKSIGDPVEQPSPSCIILPP